MSVAAVGTARKILNFLHVSPAGGGMNMFQGGGGVERWGERTVDSTALKNKEQIYRKHLNGNVGKRLLNTCP